MGDWFTSFHILIIVNNATMNTGVHISFQVNVFTFSRYIFRSELLDHMVAHFVDKGLSSQSYGFSSSHVRMSELDHKEGWAPKNWRFWIEVLEKTLESPLDCKEIKPVNTTGNQPWIFIRRIDAESEGPILWQPDTKSQLIGKDPDSGKDLRQKEKRVAEDEIVK